MVENELNARLQHAVINEGDTTTNSKPKKGEIIFNSNLNNFRVGTDGNTPYSQLDNFIKTIAAAAGSDIGDVGTPSVTISTSGDTTTFIFHELKGEPGANGQDGQDLTVKPYYNVASNATPKTLQGHLSDVGNLSSKNGIYIPANTLLTDNSTQIVQSGYLGCFIPNTALRTMSLGQSFEIVIKGQLPIRPGTSSNYSTLFYMINLNNINSKSWFTSGNYMCLDRNANASYYITNVLRIVRINTDLYSVIFLIGDPDS